MAENTSKFQLEAVSFMLAAQERYLIASAVAAVTATVFFLTWGTSGVFYGYVLISLIFIPILLAAIQLHRNARKKFALHTLTLSSEKEEEPEEETFKVYALL